MRGPQPRSPAFQQQHAELRRHGTWSGRPAKRLLRQHECGIISWLHKRVGAPPKSIDTLRLTLETSDIELSRDEIRHIEQAAGRWLQKMNSSKEELERAIAIVYMRVLRLEKQRQYNQLDAEMFLRDLASQRAPSTTFAERNSKGKVLNRSMQPRVLGWGLSNADEQRPIVKPLPQPF